MTEAFFALGTTLANMVNVETLIDAPQVLNAGRIPSLPLNKSRSLDGIPHLDGFINSSWLIDAATDAQRIAFNTAAFGDQVTAGRRVFISSLGDDGYYNPYSAVMDRPIEAVDYTRSVGGAYVKAMVVALTDCLLQSVSKSANYTVTTSDRLIYVDTSGGTRTMTLFAVASATLNTVYSFVKTSASNTLTLDGNASEAIDGNTTKSVTALNARIDLITTNGTSWVSI